MRSHPITDALIEIFMWSLGKSGNWSHPIMDALIEIASAHRHCERAWCGRILLRMR